MRKSPVSAERVKNEALTIFPLHAILSALLREAAHAALACGAAGDKTGPQEVGKR